jgi:hypothetical protein
MKAENVTRSLEIGYARTTGLGQMSICDFAAGVHATLSEMARNSGWVRAVVLRAVAGWISDWRRGQGCES